MASAEGFDSETGLQPGDGPSAGQELTTQPRAAADDSADDSDAKSPLSDLLGVPRSERELLELQREVFVAREESIRACMRNLGFEYAPDIRHHIPDAQADPPNLYGVASAIAAMRGLSEVPWESPNLAIVAELSEDAREQWLAAFGRSDSGCTGAALRDHPDVDEIPRSLSLELLELEELVVASPELTAAVESWSACMRGLGHDFEDRADLVTKMTERAVDGELSLAEVEQMELAVWKDDQTCDEQTGLGATELRVRYEIEEAYVEANRDRIVLLLEESRTSGG